MSLMTVGGYLEGENRIMAKWDHDDLRDRSGDFSYEWTKEEKMNLTRFEGTVHNVKSWSHFFDAIKAGKKTHDLRKNDRHYKVGDRLNLMRYDNINGQYTGESLIVDITYMTSEQVPCAFSSAVLSPGYCILSIQKA